MALWARFQGIASVHIGRAVLVALSPLLLAVAAAAQSLPQPPGSTTITITPEPGFFSEPSIAINPNNPQQVAAAYQDNAHIAYSSDAGKHWAIASGIAPPDYRVSGDVSVTYDNKGHAIICFMAFDKLGSFNYWGHNSSRNGLHIRRSLDGGANWEKDDIPVSVQPDRPDVPWEDKPYIVADNSHGRYAGNLYIGWTRWTLKDSELMLVRSTDDGRTWSKPIEIDNKPGLPRDDNGALEGFAGVVGPDSTFYAVWGDGNHIVLTTSRDGGHTFSRTRNVIDTAPIMFTIEALSRTNGFPQIAIDPRGGGRGGRLYITWSDYRNGDVDVFCSTSTDHGKTWSPAVRVNTDAIHNGADQFFQWLAVDPSDGSADVVFYDRRGDPRNRNETVTLAHSPDGGKSFQNYAWTTQPFNTTGVFLGDYTGLAALDGRVYGIWTERPQVASPQPRGGERPPQPVRGTAEYWKLHGAVIRIGVADFANATSARRQ
ncbi:MAG: sialidase family protein [Candidatus Acidiferrales bacterium]